MTKGADSFNMSNMDPVNLSSMERLNQSETVTQRSEEKEQVKNLNPVLLIFPSIFDLLETCLKNITLTLIATSVT